MSMSLALGLGLPFGGSVGSSALGPGIVTAVEVLGDISVAITSPSVQSVPMQTNGSTLRIATSGSANVTAVDLTKITLSVSDAGWDTSGNQTSRTRTISLNAVMLGPYNQATNYQPNLGEFYVKLSDLIYNQDATWKTTVTAVNFASGWISGQPAGQVTSVTRSDSLVYPPLPIRTPTAPWQRLASGGTYPVEIIPVSQFGRNLSQVACVEAWVVDSAATAGTVSRTSSFALSPSTPNGSTPGHPCPSYALNLDATGLLAGRVEWRWTVKPWIGPSISSATVGDTFPCLNPTVGVPFCYDTDASYAPLYVCLASNNTLPGGKTTLVNSGTSSTVNVTGVSTTIAGAVASGVVYTDIFALRAVQRVNNSGVNITIADPVTGGAFSYKRTTQHNDHAGAVLVCEQVAGSTPGTNTGSYSLFNDMSGEPVGLVAAELRSIASVVDNTIRWRGLHNDGTSLSLSSRLTPKRFRVRGIYFDSVGTTVDTTEVVFKGGTASSSTTQDTEAAAWYFHALDCKVRSDNTASTSGPMGVRVGLAWHERIDYSDANLPPPINGVAYYTGGLVSTIGSAYAYTKAGAPPAIELSGVFGCLLTNLSSTATTLGNRPIQKRIVHYNVEAKYTNTIGAAAQYLSGGGYPIVGGYGYCNILVWGTDATATGGVGFSNDSNKFETDNLVIQHLGSAWPNAVGGAGRLNNSYNEQAPVRINKRTFLMYSAVRSYNIKGDSFPGPETAANTSSHIATAGTAAWITTNAYYKGQVANDTNGGGHGYQALQDVPTGIALTNATYWLDTGLASTAYGAQPTRQGNSDARYQVGCIGNVASESADSSTAPSATAWLGYSWCQGGAFNQIWSGYYNASGSNDFTPKPSTSPLLNRVPAGSAVTPFDLVGVTLLNDGTDAAGPLQVPH